MTPRQLTALGTVYTALFGVWFLGALALHSPSARLFADAGIVLALSHSAFAWTALHWLTPHRRGLDFTLAALTLISIPLPLYALVVLSGGLTWTAVARLEIALLVLLVAGGVLLAAIRRLLPDGTVHAATTALQLAPAALLWAFRDDWLAPVLA